jgi:hypothetical protein
MPRQPLLLSLRLSLALCLLLSAAGCGEPFAPTARFVSARTGLVRIAVTAPPGSLVRLGRHEVEVPDTGSVELEDDMRSRSEVPGLPRLDVRVERPGFFGADSAYLTVEVPIARDVILAMPTEEEGARLVPSRVGGLRVVALPGSSLEVAGAPVALDAYGTGLLDVDLASEVLRAPASLAPGGTLALAATLRTGERERAFTLPVEVSSASVEAHVEGWITSPARSPVSGATGLLWAHRHRRDEPAVERVGHSPTVAMRFVATEEITSEETRRCQGGFAMIRDTRRVRVADTQGGAIVAERVFEPSGRGDCPMVFTLREPDHHFWTRHEIVRAWLETELARLEG